jgi:hypothetical protein
MTNYRNKYSSLSHTSLQWTASQQCLNKALVHLFSGKSRLGNVLYSFYFGLKSFVYIIIVEAVVVFLPAIGLHCCCHF